MSDAKVVDLEANKISIRSTRTGEMIVERRLYMFGGKDPW